MNQRELSERFHFHKRQQAPGETITEYDAALRKLATHCKFGNYLEEALHDRLVCGLHNEAIQLCLLAEADLKTMEMAQGLEAAEKRLRSFKKTEPLIKKITTDKPGKSKHNNYSLTQSCYQCGKSNHAAAECCFKDADCHTCGKKDHIAPVCRSKPKNPHNSNAVIQSRRNKKPFGTHHIKQAYSQSESQEEEFYLHKLSEPSFTPIEVTVKKEDIPLTMEIDTGASLSISESTYREKFPKLPLHRSIMKLKTYTDEPMVVQGQLNVDVKYGNQIAALVLIVVAGNGPSLFGRDWLKYIRLDWHRIATVRSKFLGLDALLKKHESLYKDELGTILYPEKATLHVKTDSIPTFIKPQPVPFAIKDAIGKELDQLEQQGIIRKVDSSD